MNTIVKIKPTVDFSEYSTKYDLLLKNSQPYQKIRELFMEQLLQKFDREQTFSFLDVGGGTGNFTKLILDYFPNAYGTLLDPSHDMLAYARHKVGNSRRVRFIEDDFERYESNNKFDLVLCVHALYLMPDSRALVPKFAEHLSETGTLMICDIGQQIKVMNWAIYLFFQNVKTYGIMKAISILREGKKVIAANRDIECKQKSGELWTHTLSEFKHMFEKYYKVDYATITYRGCSNMLICRLN